MPLCSADTPADSEVTGFGILHRICPRYSAWEGAVSGWSREASESASPDTGLKAMSALSLQYRSRHCGGRCPRVPGLPGFRLPRPRFCSWLFVSSRGPCGGAWAGSPDASPCRLFPIFALDSFCLGGPGIHSTRSCGRYGDPYAGEGKPDVGIGQRDHSRCDRTPSGADGGRCAAGHTRRGHCEQWWAGAAHVGVSARYGVRSCAGAGGRRQGRVADPG